MKSTKYDLIGLLVDILNIVVSTCIVMEFDLYYNGSFIIFSH